MGKQMKCKTVGCVIKEIVELMSQSFMSQSLIRSGLVNIFVFNWTKKDLSKTLNVEPHISLLVHQFISLIELEKLL